MKKALFAILLLSVQYSLNASDSVNVVGSGGNSVSQVLQSTVSAYQFISSGSIMIGQGINTSSASSMLDIVGGSITVRGTGAGIAIGAFSIFNSTSIAGTNNLTGYTLCMGTGTAGASTTVTIAPAGVTNIIPITAVDLNSSLVTGVGIGAWSTAGGIGATFPVKNQSGVGAADFIWAALCK